MSGWLSARPAYAACVLALAVTGCSTDSAPQLAVAPRPPASPTPAPEVVQRGDGRLEVVLASPELTDQMCAPLDTGGYFSCANGAIAVLNVARWLRGAPGYEGHLEVYRAYVVNHEVGRTLGLGHADCPGAGQVAPVMLQQTKGLDGCARGPWPHP